MKLLVGFLPFLLACAYGDDNHEDVAIVSIERSPIGQVDHHHRELNADFCWKSTYGRGVGTIPNRCASGRQLIGLLCYSRCRSGYSRFGVDCHQNCPAGFADQGLFCRLLEYGRGVGYPWVFGDPLNSSGQFARCENDHGRGNCELWGLIVYPKCKRGYSPFGCCICRPNPPNCAALGMGVQFDLSCAKKIIFGDPTIRTGCPNGKVYDAGLCYERCNPGFHGVGPVCWGQPPPGWVDCGMGAATSSLQCGLAVFDQVTSVVGFASNIITLGSGGAIAKGTQGYTNLLVDWNKLKQNFKDLVRREPSVQDYLESGVGFGLDWDAYQNIDSLTEPEDIVRMAAEISAFFDPTYVSDILASYVYPSCENIINSPSPTPGPTPRPTPQPTGSPTRSPTLSPTLTPTQLPTLNPTAVPTIMPTPNPTMLPTPNPTIAPALPPASSSCPCRRLQILCRLRNRCLSGFPGDE